MLVAPPIDYALTRQALVTAVALATGLPEGNIIRLQAAGPVQPPPVRPYCSFTYRIVSMRTGFRDQIRYSPELGPTMWTYKGVRGIAVDINFYADDQDVAYGLAGAMQAGLFQPPVRDAIKASGASIYSIGDVTDVTALLGTGFEPRTLLDLQMWVGFNQSVDLGTIEQVSLHGTVYSEDGQTIAAVIEQTTEG